MINANLTLPSSEHTDFSESTEEIAPLTAEEKAAKLAALREKLAAKRAAQADEEKIARKKNEVPPYPPFPPYPRPSHTPPTPSNPLTPLPR